MARPARIRSLSRTPERRDRGGRTRRRVPASRAGEDARRFAAYAYSADEIERKLVTGDDADALARYFGDRNYDALQALARQIAGRPPCRGQKVLIVPGSLGSMLVSAGGGRVAVVWLHPPAIRIGGLAGLAIGAAARQLHAHSVLSFAYLSLKLRLMLHGYRVDYHPYDWRQGLDRLGAELAARLTASSEDVAVVAHSMGGLVVRAALARGARHIARVIMLGTPNHGSFAAVQAIRGVYPVARQVSALDRRQSADELSSQVFSTFPGIYDMLPSSEKFAGIDLYRKQNWPRHGPTPRQALLTRVLKVRRSLAAADDRFIAIVGVNRETVSGLTCVGGEFVYARTMDGDGTVARDFAELDGVTTYYVEESHGGLANNAAVAEATAQLLRSGATDRLLGRRPVLMAPPPAGVVTDAMLRKSPYGGRRGFALTDAEIRTILEPAHETGLLP
jgi:pimeloyl-ACP methyl ester carboxylesterase